MTSEVQRLQIAAVADTPGPEEVRLIVVGKKFSGWTSVRVTRGIERCPNDFELTFTEVQPDEPRTMTITPGDPCEVSIGKQLVLAGYVDRQMIEMTPESHSIGIVGRGKCQDLVDCSALWPGQVIVNSTVLQVAQRLAKPFGIEVSGAGVQVVGEGSLLPYVVVPIGETCWSVIERLCAVAGLMAYELPDGNLYVGPGPVPSRETAAIAQQQGIPSLTPSRAASGFTEGVNVISARATFANDGRFSEYLAHRMSVEQFREVGESFNLVGTATDGGVGRYRVLAFVAEAGQEPSYRFAEQTAEWEAARRWGRSRAVQITTDSWHDSAGRLYEPNTLAPLDLPSLKVTGQEWLITEVTYRKDDAAGTQCDLTLMRPEAFLLQPTLPAYVLPADIATLPPNLAQP